jgi:DNA-binding NtrC family response regulator/pSer/pThr/pTyr-binding forkhead associated (FHA) protein
VSDDRTTATAAIIVDDLQRASGTADSAFLVVYYGQGYGSRGLVVPLPDADTVTIGRLETSTVPIDHELVSRRHARVTRRRADIVVEDLDSRNGTRVNGVQIDGPTRVSTGDEITVGPAAVIVGVTTSMRQHTLVGSTFELEDRLAAEMDRSIRYRRPLGLTMMRIDGSMDAAAAAIERVGRSLRRMDYLGQYSRDEFAILLPEADADATQAAALRLVREARAAGQARGGVSVHVGIATCPADAAHPGKLVSRARAALRAARATGSSEGIAAAPAEETPTEGNIVVVDPLMKRVYSMARKVADTPITVLVLGETGVGKEIVANTIHQASQRAGKPFQALNCSALPETLLESELFGYERGAFTGADRRKPGYFEAASGGTVFLDEVGEMPLGVQAKLLRVLEQRVITRVGGTATVPIDVRVVCATNRDLEKEVQRNRFREDLYFRMSAFTLVVPPLRDRKSEIVPLAQHFARQFALELGQPQPEFSRGARDVLEAYQWPGNVRELRNAIERAIVLQPRGTVDVEHLPERIVATVQVEASGGDTAPRGVGRDTEPMDVRSKVASFERATIVAALEECEDNQTRAAKHLGISRWALIRLMQKYGLKKKPKRTR